MNFLNLAEHNWIDSKEIIETQKVALKYIFAWRISIYFAQEEKVDILKWDASVVAVSV